MSSNWTNVTVNSDIHSEIDDINNYIYEYVYGHVVLKICYFVVRVVILTVGPFLSSTIVYYEHYGADSQKRTILNRLCSVIYINIALHSVIYSILRILRDIFGLLPSGLVTPVILFLQELRFSGVLFATELACFRFLYIVIWKRMKVINDEFWMRVLSMSTHLICTYMCLIIYLLRGGVYEVTGIINIGTYTG